MTSTSQHWSMGHGWVKYMPACVHSCLSDLKFSQSDSDISIGHSNQRTWPAQSLCWSQLCLNDPNHCLQMWPKLQSNDNLPLSIGLMSVRVSVRSWSAGQYSSLARGEAVGATTRRDTQGRIHAAARTRCLLPMRTVELCCGADARKIMASHNSRRNGPMKIRLTGKNLDYILAKGLRATLNIFNGIAILSAMFVWLWKPRQNGRHVQR